MADLIAFHRVGLADRDQILAYLEDNPYCNCDYSFGNLYNWGFLYLTSVAFHKDMMLIRFRSWETGSQAYLMPIGKGNLVEVLKDMEHTSKVEGHPLILMAVQDSAIELLEQTHPTSIKIFSNRDNADYLYDREKLETLSGKKLQSKRNHINRFKRQYPDYIYEPLSDENTNECIALENRWYADTETTPGMSDEREMVMRALKEWKEIGLQGGCIRVDGKVVAFTMGMPISHACFGVHIEKADTDYDGSFTIINQEFVSRLPEQYVRINREEDLGLEGLRKAKLSYQPMKILEKHKVAISYEED